MKGATYKVHTMAKFTFSRPHSRQGRANNEVWHSDGAPALS